MMRSKLMSHALANTTGGNDMKVLLLQQPESFSNYPKWIEEVQECFDCLESYSLNIERSSHTP